MNENHADPMPCAAQAADPSLAGVLLEAARLVSARVEPCTMQELCRRYLDDYASVTMARSTYRRQVYTVQSVILPHFGAETQVSSIRPADCQAFVADRMAEGCAASTAKKSLDQLRTLFARGVEWGYLATNPAADARRPKSELAETGFLAPAEVRALIAAAGPGWRAAFCVLALCGLRGGEFLGLRWCDVDFDAHCVHVRRAWSEGAYVVPKTKASVRTIPMTPTVERALSAHRADQPDNELGVVFANREGRPLDWNNFRKRVFHPTLERAGITRHVRLHDLRHSYASLLIEQGENLKTVQYLMGHSSIRTTVDRYGHLVKDSLNPVAIRLDELVFAEEEEVSRENRI